MEGAESAKEIEIEYEEENARKWETFVKEVYLMPSPLTQMMRT